MLRPILALAVLVGLSGCAELGVGNNLPWGNGTPRYPSETRRAPTYGGRADETSRTNEYRRVRSDAAAYATYVDRNLRLNGREESQIRDVVERRAYDLLRRTQPRSHARVYPFPRNANRNPGFWRDVDRDVERVIGRQHRDDYRSLVRYGHVQDRDRYDDRRDDRDRYDDGERRNRDRAGDRYRDQRRGRDARRQDDRRRRDDDRGRDARRTDDRRQGESLEDWYRRQQRERGGD